MKYMVCLRETRVKTHIQILLFMRRKRPGIFLIFTVVFVVDG